MTTPDTARDAWDWPAAKRHAKVAVEIPLRPSEMLAAHGLEVRFRCGDCREYIGGINPLDGRCVRSLRGNAPNVGYRWQANWRACGAWLSHNVADAPETAAPGAQLALGGLGRCD